MRAPPPAVRQLTVCEGLSAYGPLQANASPLLTSPRQPVAPLTTSPDPALFHTHALSVSGSAPEFVTVCDPLTVYLQPIDPAIWNDIDENVVTTPDPPALTDTPHGKTGVTVQFPSEACLQVL